MIQMSIDYIVQQNYRDYESKGEKAIGDYLKRKKISFDKQVSFPDLVSKYGNLLRYDFIISKQALIELDGIQHYTHIPRLESKATFKRMQENDAKKDKYAQDHNIPLLRIVYTGDNLDKVILEISKYITAIENHKDAKYLSHMSDSYNKNCVDKLISKITNLKKQAKARKSHKNQEKIDNAKDKLEQLYLYFDRKLDKPGSIASRTTNGRTVRDNELLINPLISYLDLSCFDKPIDLDIYFSILKLIQDQAALYPEYQKLISIKIAIPISSIIHMLSFKYSANTICQYFVDMNYKFHKITTKAIFNDVIDNMNISGYNIPLLTKMVYDRDNQTVLVNMPYNILAKGEHVSGFNLSKFVIIDDVYAKLLYAYLYQYTTEENKTGILTDKRKLAHYLGVDKSRVFDIVKSSIEKLKGIYKVDIDDSYSDSSKDIPFKLTYRQDIDQGYHNTNYFYEFNSKTYKGKPLAKINATMPERYMIIAVIIAYIEKLNDVREYPFVNNLRINKYNILNNFALKNYSLKAINKYLNKIPELFGEHTVGATSYSGLIFMKDIGSEFLIEQSNIRTLSLNDLLERLLELDVLNLVKDKIDSLSNKVLPVSIKTEKETLDTLTNKIINRND